MHSLLHDIPLFLILFLEELFLIFNQMLSIRAFGRRVFITFHRLNEDHTCNDQLFHEQGHVI